MAGQVFTYEIKTMGDLRAFLQVESSLKRQIALAQSAGKDISGLQQKLSRVQTSLAGMGNKIPGAPSEGGGATSGGGGGGGLAAIGQQIGSGIPGGQALSGIAAAATPAAAAVATVSAAIGLATAALVEFAAKQSAVADLDQVLSNQGQLTDEYRERLQELANTMEDATNIADDQWLGALTKLTQAGADASNIDQLTEATKNYAAITGTDAVSAGQAIGRALKGQFTAFQRQGIVIDKNATQTEKLNSLYEQLAQRGGGVLENRTKTLTGEFQTLKTATGNFTEGLGNLINRGDGANRILAGLSTVIEFYAGKLPKTIESTVDYSNIMKKAALSAEELEQAETTATAQSKEFTKANTESTAALDKEISAIDKKRQLLDSQTDAETALKLAQIDLAEAQGTKTGSQAGVERAQVRAAAEQEKIKRELIAIADRESEINKQQEESVKSIAATEAERIGLLRTITEELAKQQEILGISRFERTVGGNDPNLQKGFQKEFAESGKREAAARANLPGATDLLAQKQKAFKEQEDKAGIIAAENASRQKVLELQKQTAGLTLSKDVGIARAQRGPADIQKQAEAAASRAQGILDTPATGLDQNGARTKLEAVKQALGVAGQNMTRETVELAQLTLRIVEEQAAAARKQKEDLLQLQGMNRK